MSKEEIRKNNILIAQYMGYEYISKGMWKYLDENYGERLCKHSHLINFHSDWNCLMKVVQRINGDKKNNYLLSIAKGVIIEEWKDDIFEWCGIEGFGYPFTIEGLYAAVIETIKLIKEDESKRNTTK